MRPESSDWEKLHTMGQVSKLSGREGDSVVYGLRNDKIEVVAKQYEALRERFVDPEWVEDILRQYYADTEKAEEILLETPNPLNQKIRIDDIDYDFSYAIVPQGGLMLKGEGTYSHRAIEEEPVSAPLVVGQKFIKGQNLLSIMLSKRSPIKKNEMEDNQTALYGNEELCGQIVTESQKLFDFLNARLKVDFTYSRMNIKPFLKETDHKIEVVITDLAASITSYYDNSESLEKLRDGWRKRKDEEWEARSAVA